MRLLNLMNEIIFKWYIRAKCILKICQYIGRDGSGNQYYEETLKGTSRTPRRWVLYHGLPEATKVSAEWYNWLRHLSATPPTSNNLLQYSWQQPYLPNLTGTKKAYRTHSSKTQSKKYRSWISN